MSLEWQLRMAATWRMLRAILRGIAVGLAAALRLLFTRGGLRASMAMALATLVVIAAGTASITPALSAPAQGFAVLLLAGFGIWMMVSSPFRRRR